MRSVSGERAQVKAGEREGGSRVMNLALGGWWRLCHRSQLEHLVQLKHLEHYISDIRPLFLKFCLQLGGAHVDLMITQLGLTKSTKSNCLLKATVNQ